MTQISTKSNVLAVCEETTQGTPASPASGSDFIATQDDFDIDPGYETLENAERRASIGKAKPVVGGETPTVTGSHYLRASGVEGTAPGFHRLMKAGFGTETVKATQQTVAAASTAALVKVGSGIGADFERGQGMLVKDATNGFSLRAVKSVSGDDITPSFDLPGAPAAGTGLGKSVFYKPANSGHKSLTFTEYLGAGGGKRLAAGLIATELGIEFNAGEFINMSYAFGQGQLYSFNGIDIGAADIYIDFTDDDGTFAAAVTAQHYRDPHELASAMQTAMNAANSNNAKTVTYDDETGEFTIVGTGTLLSLLFTTGTNNANSIADKIGFEGDQTGTAATTGYTGSALDWSAPYTPSYDNADPLVAKDNEVLLGTGGSNYKSLEASSVSYKLSNETAALGSVRQRSGKGAARVAGRAITMSITAPLEQNDASWFRNLREGTELACQYNFGVKTGGNWVAGKCGYLYNPTLTVSNVTLNDENGVMTATIELAGFVDSSGNGETYLGLQ